MGHGSTPKSDSELLVSQIAKGKAENPEMLWAWGEFPQAAKVQEQTIIINVLLLCIELLCFAVVERMIKYVLIMKRCENGDRLFK